MESVTEVESGTRARTRRAIIEAAVALLARNPGASLTEVAAEAGVGRTTVHRYFPERSDLVAALTEEAGRRVDESAQRARLADGDAAEALIRLTQEYFELGDWLTLLFTEGIRLEDEASGHEEGGPSDQAVEELIRRGHREGTIDAAMPTSWLVNLLWAVLFAAWSQVRAGEATRHDATSLCLATLRKAVAPSSP